MAKTYNLNEIQLKIMQDVEGAVLVSAGAGSGKTRLLTHRILYLMEEKNVDPKNILAITFTNKATNEMRERLMQMHAGGGYVFVSTFHSMCAKILRENIYKIEGYNNKFTIYDEDDKTKVIRILLKEFNIASELKDSISKHISNAKNEGLECGEYLNYLKYDWHRSEIAKVFTEYEKRLHSSNALDFDDLLLKTLILFKNNSDVLEYYQNRFKYIHVDEFQDTNLVQYKIIALLADKHKNVFAVGDEDQCIYRWRGANIDNIKNFIKNFNSKVYKLEQNYRSTKNILSVANALIKHNVSRIEKTLFTHNDNGDEVTCFSANDELEEAEFVAKNIYNLISRGVSASEIGVLMRISALSRLIEEKLLNYDIAYKVAGIFKFFERAEIKDILAYFKVVSNNADLVSLLRIINVPKRNLGQATIEKLQEAAREKNLNLFDFICKINSFDDVLSAVKLKVQGFSKLLCDLTNAYENLDLYEFAKFLISETKIKDMYPLNTDEDYDKKLNIDQLLQSVQTFSSLNEGGLTEYLESVSLQSNLDNDDATNKVSISTVHASKGLEFDYVFIIGAEEGKFPLSRSLDEPDDLEEERRLMYVAITRARKKVYITKAKSRYIYGERKGTLDSRFLCEMGIIEKESNVVKFAEYPHNNYYAKQTKRADNTQFSHAEPIAAFEKVSFNDKSNFSKFGNTFNRPSFAVAGNKPKILYEEGMQVLHLKYGVGKVKKVDSAGAGSLFVDFGAFGVKVLSLDAPLKIIPQKN